MEKVFEIYIKATPERLWEAITDGETRARYNFGVRVDSDWTPGSRYESSHPAAGVSIERVRSRTARRIRVTSGVSVRTPMPSRAGRWQEAGNPRWPSTWTRQVRQAPRGGRSGSLHSWGSGRPSRLTASRTVAPSGTSTACPSMLSRMALRYPS